MLNGLINSIILFFDPSLLIPKREWRALWTKNERVAYLKPAQAMCLTFTVVYLLHYYLVDMTKDGGLGDIMEDEVVVLEQV